jgi:hypothetical protein
LFTLHTLPVQRIKFFNQQSPPGDRVHTAAGRRVFARRNFWEDHRIKMRKRIETRRQDHHTPNTGHLDTFRNAS